MNMKYIQYLSFPKQLFFIVKLVSQKDYKLLKYLFELFVKELKLSRLKTIICLRYFTIYKVLVETETEHLDTIILVIMKIQITELAQ